MIQMGSKAAAQVICAICDRGVKGAGQLVYKLFIYSCLRSFVQGYLRCSQA